MVLSRSERILPTTALLVALAFGALSGHVIDGFDMSADAGDDYQDFNVTASYATAAAGTQNNLTPSYRSGYDSGTPITDSDLQCLSELPVDKLLRIRKTLRYVSHMLDGVEQQQQQQPKRQSWAATANWQTNRTADESGENRRMNGGYANDKGSQTHRAVDGAHASALMMDQFK